jgi:protocatechuate 3,4-dioxygenase beta subunit
MIAHATAAPSRTGALSLGLLALTLAGCAPAATAQDRAVAEQVADGPANPPASIVMVPDGEPGTPLVLEGTIFQADGQTPAPGIRLFVYHTDATGYYRPLSDRSGDHTPRLRGWITTGPDGRYTIRTIRPGAYPGRTDPAHVHAAIAGPGYPAHWIGDWWFQDDPLVTDAATARARAAAERYHAEAPVVVRLERDEKGVLHARRDLRLRPPPGGSK